MKKKAKAKKKATKKGWAAGLLENVWPQERDFFQRPERYKYVRKLLPQTDACVFCTAEKSNPSFESLVLFKSKLAMIIMNKYPYNNGHLLVLPRAHVGNIWDVDDPTTAEVAKWMKISTRILQDALNCQGFNLGLNHGAVAGAGIPAHLHWHIIPRWGGDTNFFPLIAETKVLAETLEATYQRLKPLFDKEAK